MPEFVTLSCPSCGGELIITSDIDRFACGHCGRAHIVKRAGGIVSLAPIVEALRKVEAGIDKTASEMAINRLHREIEELRSRRTALIGTFPKSDVTPFDVWLIGVGILLAIVSLGLSLGDPRAILCLGASIAMAVIGAIPFFRLSPGRRHWQETTGSQLSAIEKDIARKEAEMASHRRVVA